MLSRCRFPDGPACYGIVTTARPAPSFIQAAGKRKEGQHKGKVLPRLLIADDDPLFAEFVKTAAVDLGYDVRTVCDGDQVEAVRRSFGPDVIMVDMVLPGRDGIEVVRQLVEAGVAARLLLVSGHTPAYMNAARAIAGAAGVTDVIVARKPLALAKLREMLS